MDTLYDEIDFQKGAAVAFGLMGMAEAIRDRAWDRNDLAASSTLPWLQRREYDVT